MAEHWDADQVSAREQQLHRLLGATLPTEQLANEAHRRHAEEARRRRKRSPSRPPRPGPPKSPFRLTY
jgi:hypothetical protein